MAWLAPFLLAGCIDGYPTEDAKLSNPAAMSQSERIEAMNDLGKEGPGRWEYQLEPACGLEVRAAPDAGHSERHDIALDRGWQVSHRPQAHDLHEVWLEPQPGHTGQPVRLLVTDSQLYAKLMQALVREIRNECMRAQALPAPTGKQP